MSPALLSSVAAEDKARLIDIDGVANLRDVGGYLTKDGRRVRSGRLLRSASLHLLDEDGQQQLISRGLRHVIDLRHDHELEQAPNVFRESEKVKYQNVSLFAGLSPERLPIGAIPTLLEMYLELLQDSQDLIVQAIEPFASGETALVHCSAGKDRTGIIVALLLDLVGVERETIVHDYTLTDIYLEPLRDTFRDYARQAGHDMVQYEHMISCRPEYMRDFLDHLYEHYGGARNYLLQAGLSEAQLHSIVDELTESA